VKRIIAISTILVSFSFLLLAQNPPQKPAGDQVQKDQGGYVIRTDTTLIQIPVSVHDKDGHPVNSLTQDQFRFRRQDSAGNQTLRP